MPRVSVVLPVFNGAATVASTLDSIIGQTFEDFEVVVVDDGSADATPEILQRYAKADARLVVTRTPNRGLVPALNTALDAARGDYVARMDADDICHPQRFSRQVEYLDRTANAVVVGSQVLLIDERGAPLPHQPPTGRGYVMKDRCRGFAYFPPAPPTVAHPTAMMRRAVLEAAGRYRAYFAIGSEDRDLWWRLMKFGDIHRIPERLVQYRLHTANLSRVRHRDIAAAALVADLSAAARHFGLADEALLGTLTRANSVEVLRGYSALLEDRYPVRALVHYRAAKRKEPDLAAWVDRSEMRREIARHLLRNPDLTVRWRLLQAAMI